VRSHSAWSEASLSEDPAVALLAHLGHEYVAPEQLDAERDTYKDAVLATRLRRAIERMNPHLTPENVGRAVRAITHATGTSLAEVNQALHLHITHGLTVQQDVGRGVQGQVVRVIDFDRPAANEFIVTRQFKVKGSKKHIIADTVVFVNGLPLAVLELKNPTLGDIWLHQAVDQLLRYQEARDGFQGEGAPQLFHTAQLLVAACGQRAAYGTIGTPQRYFAEWKTTYPALEEVVTKALGRKATPQDIALWGLFQPANLLDLVRNFAVYEKDPTVGQVVHKLPRYPQFLAVNKAVARIKAAKKPEDRGGVIWHTQGSGKSLTMLWLALKLRRDPVFENPTIVIVTDRTDLDDQISGTFQAAGFPNPERADSVRDLREQLSGPPAGLTLTTTVQKFQDLAAGGGRGMPPVLNESENVFVLVDEAHRTQYRSLAANMRAALPNACFLGFTGTPIDQNDRSTKQTFGPYIDTYTIEQAVADKATVPIFYESRLPKLQVIGSTLDKLFEAVFANRSKEERAAIKQKFATEAAIASAPKRIEAICLDLIEHFTTHIRPNGFKAQVVAVSREAAVLYKETLDRLNAPPSAIIMSSTNDDASHLTRWAMSDQERKSAIERFKKPSDPLAILVVCDMLITGFDAPVEQVMYLDSPLKEHTLLQAIARVNRKADQKTYGLVVDYWGVSEALKEALAIFSPKDVQGAMKPRADTLPRLQALHAAARKFMAKVKDRNDLDACVALLEPEDFRLEFDQAFRAFSAALDMVLPDPAGLRYVADAKWLGKVRQAARARYHDQRLDISDCGAKVKKLIEDAIAADGVEILVKEVSPFSGEFEKKLDALATPEAKASEMEHAIRHEIHVKVDRNPVFYESLRERLEKLIEDREAKRIDAAKQLELLKVLAKEVEGEEGAAQEAGLTDVAFAIYGVLDKGLGVPKAGEPVAEYKASRQKLAALVEEAIFQFVEIPGWTEKADVQREMRKAIKDRLQAGQITKADQREALTASIVEITKVQRGR
jgi:type I restriction enzyme, R subunit